MAKGDRGPADFVAKVVSDPKNPPQTRLLSGWLGDAGEEGYQRLYTTAELSAYVDIPSDAVLHTEARADVQPAGAVLVWVKADADLRWGGSAASRAAGFLQGQVQQDFASDPKLLDKLGYRCVTKDPCAEPTGFSGLCTKQPEIGGGWPCITLIPHCAEPTGFTGKCTHVPWPNPTRYVGCTYLHCPTNDLTCIPQICHIVATGQPGCGVVDPGPVIAPGVKAAAAGGEGGGEAAAVAVTSLLGCGFTKSWGNCETQLLGCGFTKQWGHQCPTQLLGCGFTKQGPLCQLTQPNHCGVSIAIPCITHDAACAQPGGDPGREAFRAAAPGGAGPIVDTQILQCNPSAVDACPSVHGPLCQTHQPPTALGTQFGGHLCHTPETTCTQVGPQCPTACGTECQSQQPNCTQVGEICLTRPVECTHFDPKCPSIGIACTVVPPCGVTPVPICLQAERGAQGFAAAAGPGPIGPTGFQGCTQTGNNCLTIPDGDCTFFGNCPTPGQAHCPSCGAPQCTVAGPGCPPTPATVCTQQGPQCPTQFGSGCPTDAAIDCTFGCTLAGTGCPVTTPGAICDTPNVAAARAQFGAGGAAPVVAGGIGTRLPWLCNPTPATRCLICPPLTVQQWQCAPTPVTRCLICQPLTRNPVQCGGSAVDACPTRICGEGQQFRTPGNWPTPQTQCFVCDPFAARRPPHITAVNLNCDRFTHLCG